MEQMHAPQTQKITLILPADLVAKAKEASGESLTKTIQHALERDLHRRACKAMLEARGTIDLQIDLERLRDDS